LGTHIPEDLYRKILGVLPVVCVDILIKRDSRYLLVNRANEPLKGVWWVPGGRIQFNEDPEQAVRRKALEETELTLSDVEFVGYYSEKYDTSSLEVPCHTISLVFEAFGHGEVKINKEAFSWVWSHTVPNKFIEGIRGYPVSPSFS
jgi:ADP-ribose pyrophosphatase YjhB (NUDIX family)